MGETSLIRTMAGSLVIGAVLAGAAAVQMPVAAAAASQAASLGTVKLTQAAMADGKALPAGTYTLRVSSDPVNPVLGQGPDAAKWVEFVQGGQVKGRELATIVAPADVKAVAKRTPPEAGKTLVSALSDNYLRIWVNDKGSQYLIHLTRAAGK